MKRKYKWVCEECGSSDVMAEGSAFWNREEQRWEWGWDDTFCHDCQETVLVRKENLPPEIPTNTQIV